MINKVLQEKIMRVVIEENVKNKLREQENHKIDTFKLSRYY